MSSPTPPSQFLGRAESYVGMPAADRESENSLFGRNYIGGHFQRQEKVEEIENEEGERVPPLLL